MRYLTNLEPTEESPRTRRSLPAAGTEPGEYFSDIVQFGETPGQKTGDRKTVSEQDRL